LYRTPVVRKAYDMRSLANLLVQVGEVLVDGLQSRPGGRRIILRGLQPCQRFLKLGTPNTLTGLLGAILSPLSPFVDAETLRRSRSPGMRKKFGHGPGHPGRSCQGPATSKFRLQLRPETLNTTSNRCPSLQAHRVRR
jgi:hypothetical protein